MDKTIEELLNNKKVKDKLNEAFLKLMAKNKMPRNPFDEARSQTHNPVDKSNPRNEMEVI